MMMMMMRDEFFGAENVVKIWTLKKEEKIHARKKKTRVKLRHILKGLVRVIEKQHQRGGLSRRSKA